tara:strand:+ start:3275 stop:3667 length:393 start_codon:yes stop_codon:yes gene_type:complete
MTPKFKGKIISSLRKLTYSWPARNEVKKRAKVDAALFQCEICTTYCYEGKSEDNLKKLQEKYPDKTVVKRKMAIDHIDPVFPMIKGWQFNWDDIINNMFCDEDGLQCICSECHDEKTKIENEQRNNLKKC